MLIDFVCLECGVERLDPMTSILTVNITSLLVSALIVLLSYHDLRLVSLFSIIS
jgi:hypothetical protein